MDARERALSFESSMNKRYLRILDEKIERETTPYRQSAVEYSSLKGRVSLEAIDSSIVNEFYVGPTHIDVDGLYVISWAAPAAEAFYKGLKSWDNQKIRVRRRLINKQHQIVNFADEWVAHPTGEAFPATHAEKPIAKPTRQSASPSPSWLTKAKASQESTKTTQSLPKTPEHLPSSSAQPAEPAQPPASIKPTGTESPFMPASPLHPPKYVPQPISEVGPTIGEILKEALSAPRSMTMESVLDTLQPEQYELVTNLPNKSLVIQGHAGTGKTIVATHRAAWLVNEARAGKPLKRVLLFGPTIAWEGYVKSAVRELAGNTDTIVVGSSRSLILNLLGINGAFADTSRWSEPKPPPAGADDLVIDFAASWEGNSRAGDALGSFYSEFASDGAKFEMKLSKSLDGWRHNLPPFSEAIQDLQLWPLLAYMHVSIANPQRFDHIIVDEAQDLTSFEWRILETLNSGTWTLTGDMQQRHSQRMFKKWKDIIGWLAHSTWDERQMSAGYRTTEAITEFAASLLPLFSRSRTHSPLGRGKNPQIISVKDKQRSLESLALEFGSQLTMNYPTGLVAVISPLIPSIMQEARRSGWHPMGKGSFQTPQGFKVEFLTPEDARGLEFDAVVVVEPGIFRADTGTYGRLYTSLTRANKELVVIYDKPMPAPLERAARRLVSRS